MVYPLFIHADQHSDALFSETAGLEFLDINMEEEDPIIIWLCGMFQNLSISRSFTLAPLFPVNAPTLSGSLFFSTPPPLATTARVLNQPFFQGLPSFNPLLPRNPASFVPIVATKATTPYPSSSISAFAPIMPPPSVPPVSSLSVFACQPTLTQPTLMPSLSLLPPQQGPYTPRSAAVNADSSFATTEESRPTQPTPLEILASTNINLGKASESDRFCLPPKASSLRPTYRKYCETPEYALFTQKQAGTPTTPNIPHSLPSPSPLPIVTKDSQRDEGPQGLLKVGQVVFYRERD